MCPVARWGRLGVFACCQSYISCITSARLPGHEDCGKADDRESEGAEDATNVQKKTLLLSHWFVRAK